jgi:hypothetical protein
MADVKLASGGEFLHGRLYRPFSQTAFGGQFSCAHFGFSVTTRLV